MQREPAQLTSTALPTGGALRINRRSRPFPICVPGSTRHRAAVAAAAVAAAAPAAVATVVPAVLAAAVPAAMGPLIGRRFKVFNLLTLNDFFLAPPLFCYVFFFVFYRVCVHFSSKLVPLFIWPLFTSDYDS